jgi:hypothetical protein
VRAWIVVSSPGLKTGEFLILVVSPAATSGNYKLSTTVEDIRACSPSTISQGETSNGELTSADCRDLDIFVPGSNPSPTDPWKLDITERALVKVTMRSSFFDTYLSVVDKDSKELSGNDDFEATTADSRIRISLDPGVYSALASRYEGAGLTT